MQWWRTQEAAARARGFARRARAHHGEVPTTMRCPTCKTHQLVLIDMTLRGEPVRMASCSSCDARWWEGPGGSLPLSDVLALAGRG